MSTKRIKLESKHVSSSSSSKGGEGGEGGEEEDAQKHQNRVEIMFIVDRSGSMEAMGNEVYMGFNAFVHAQQVTQKKTNNKVFLSTIMFDNVVDTMYTHKPIQDVQEADASTFQPRGMTALFDAVVSGIVAMDAMDTTDATDAIDTTILNYAPPKVIFVILTDGAENSSRCTKEKFQRLVKHRTEKGWEFVFLAANQDAIGVGQDFGFRQEACMTFESSEKSCSATMSAVSRQIQRAVTQPESQVVFSKLEREASVPSQHAAQHNAQHDAHSGHVDHTGRLGRCSSVPTTNYVYAVLSAECVEPEGENFEVVSVIVRFHSQEELDVESDNFFDNLPSVFDQGLPCGWVQDDVIELSHMVTEKEAKEKGFVVFTAK
jgi:hypothetical protein